MPRLPRLLLLLIAFLLAVAAFASQSSGGSSAIAETPAEIQFKEILDTTVSSGGEFAGACHAAVREGTAGVVVRRVKVADYGPVDARLAAPSGDWDLAVFDADGTELAAGAGPGGNEIANGWTFKGGDVVVQACRRTGGAPEAKLTLEHGTVPQTIEETLLGQKVQMISVDTPTKADKDRLTNLGLDLTEHGGHSSMGVVLHGAADEQKLRNAGFTFDVLEDDLVRAGVEQARAQRRSAARIERTSLPSGRTDYRVLADYETEMKTLAQQNPGLVRLIELPNKTWEGRTVMGVEISTNVNANDGKPTFFNMGVHHAREWPSGEHAMEWAIELIKGFKAGDPRATKVVTQSRNLVVPIVNPDGFNASRTAGKVGGADGGRDEEAADDTAYIVAGVANGGEYRRKNCRIGDTEEGNCTTSPGAGAENGTDPNRNYGGLWGGPGAEATINGLTYRGPGPFSEPETRNVQALVSKRQVMSLITNHTTAGLVLRAPGLAVLGDPVDENKGYKALGDAMALENGYFSQKSFELYDTTGTTEDWSYNATGGFGFTFEIYCGAPNYTSGDCDDPAFHPLYETMAKEWDGESDQNNHKNDPGKSDAAPFGMQKDYDGKGNREAYYIAAESAINNQRHSIIEGDAPAGATLRLTKAFKTATFPQPDAEGKPILFDDKLETVYDVPDSGKFQWHINPSTRPIVAKDSGRDKNGNPSPGVEFAYDGPTTPCPRVLICGAANDDREFTVPAQQPGVVDNGKMRIRIAWETQASDYDLKIFRPGAPPLAQGPLYSSAQSGTNSEEVVIPEPSGTYLVRIYNVNGVEPWSGTIKYESPDPFVKGLTENWTLSCELNGQVLQTSEVFIERGEVKRPDLGVCDRRVRELRAGTPSNNPPQALPPIANPATCNAGSGFRSVNVKPSGRGLKFDFARRVNAPVTVSVFQQSRGRRITGEQLVARFTRKTKGFTWNGRATTKRRRVGDGYLFVRFSIKAPEGVDTRRLTVRRSKGKFSKRPDFYRRATCDALPSFKIERPVFGGASNRPLNVSFRLVDPARVRVDVLRGDKVVKKFGPTSRRAAVTHRLRVDPKSLPRGEYKVRITVFIGTRPLVATLVARRL